MSMRMFTSKGLSQHRQLFYRNFAPIYIPTTLYKHTFKILFGFCFQKKKKNLSQVMWCYMEQYEEA